MSRTWIALLKRVSEKKYFEEKLQELRHKQHDNIRYRRRKQQEEEDERYLKEELEKKEDE